jgi:hypothetical protein
MFFKSKEIYYTTGKMEKNYEILDFLFKKLPHLRLEKYRITLARTKWLFLECVSKNWAQICFSNGVRRHTYQTMPHAQLVRTLSVIHCFLARQSLCSATSFRLVHVKFIFCHGWFLWAIDDDLWRRCVYRFLSLNQPFFLLLYQNFMEYDFFSPLYFCHFIFFPVWTITSIVRLFSNFYFVLISLFAQVINWKVYWIENGNVIIRFVVGRMGKYTGYWYGFWRQCWTVLCREWKLF